MQPEAKIGKKIREYLEGIGAFVFKVHGGPQMTAGLPDLIACVGGLFIGIEVKCPGQLPTQIQKLRHEQIRKADGVAFVATSVDDVERELNKLFEGGIDA